MKKLFLILCISLFVVKSNAQDHKAEIKWMSMQEALSQKDKKKKKILIDFFTDWCGWCKRMDKATYEDPRVVAMVTKYFYPVKFNAEKETPINYKGKEYSIKAQGIRGTHELATSLLNGRMGYPTTTFLAENQDMIVSQPGYIEAKQMLIILKFFGENHHLNPNINFDQFSKEESAKIQ